MAIELKDIPETAHLWIQRRKVAYSGLMLGAGITQQERQDNAAALNNYLNNAAGGVLELPAGAAIEIDGALLVPDSMRIQGNNCTIVDMGAITNRQLIGPNTTGLTIDIERLTLQGHAEVDVVAAGGTGVRAIGCVGSTKLSLHNIAFTGWFGNAVVGSVGSDLDIDSCIFQAWMTHGAGGDGTRGWRVRNCTFGRIGSGSGLHHHLYTNPDVWLYLENCEFLNPEANDTNWGVHYYGSDEVGPYRTPVFRDCLFRRKVFTGEKSFTIIEDCDFEDTILQIQNNALIRGGSFRNATMSQRTPAAKSVRLDSVTASNSRFFCEIQHTDGTLYQFTNCHLATTGIDNRVNALNRIEVLGGLWESGRLDLANSATAHLDGRLHIGNDVTYLMGTGSSYTTGDVIYY